MNTKPHFSAVVPVYNEAGNVIPLYTELHAVLQSLGKSFEIIFVDDASSDTTLEELKSLSDITIITLRRNSGQSSALDAGIKQATGEILITMDGDGQDDPGEIPKLLEELDNGYDVVCAWRQKRNDSSWKRFLSWGWRLLRSKLVDDGVHDAGTQFRVYKREVFEDIDIYGELHRFIPALLKWRGYTVGEVSVHHRMRVHGKSKYNWIRPLKGLSDMVYIWFWRKYSTRPLHFFGGFGLISIFLGIVLLVVLAYMRLFMGYPLSDKIWPLVGFFLILMGVQSFSIGLLAGQIIDQSTRKKYYIREIIEH